MNRENAEKIVEPYEKLLSECYKIARENDGELMGKDKWLRFAISESDMTLWPVETGILCEGYTFTTQTQSTESFSFEIPYNRIRL